MKNLISMDAFGIRRDIKKGIGLKEYCATYNCSEDDLIYHIRRIFVSTTESEKIIKQMRKNSADNEAELQRRARKSQKQSLRLQGKSTGNGGAAAADIPEGDGITPNPPPMEISASPSDPLAELRAQEQSLSDEVIRLESEHKRLNGLHCGCLDRLRNIQKNIQAIRDQLQKEGEAYEQIVSQNNQIVQGMNDISQQRSGLLSELCELRQEIKAKTIIEVFVYTDGNIELVDAKANVPLDHSGSDELYADLIGRDSLQDLRIRDIRALAKIIQIVHNSELHIQPTFEDDSLEPYFKSLIPQPAPEI